MHSIGTTPTNVVLGPLSVQDTAALVADTVQSDVAAVLPLAELVHQKTAGNPFFVIQFLTVLHDEGLIAAFPRSGLVWDVATIRDIVLEVVRADDPPFVDANLPDKRVKDTRTNPTFQRDAARLRQGPASARSVPIN